MRARFLVPSLALLLAVTPALAAGRGEPGQKEAGFYAGWALLDDYGDAQPEDAPIVGLRFGQFFTPHMSLEGTLQRIFSETAFDGALGRSDEDADIDALRANVLWNYRRDAAVRPFITGGAGIERVDVPGSDSTDLSLNAGGGVRWFLIEGFGLRFDARYVYTDVRGALKEGQSNIELTLGASWYFGGGPPPDADGDGVRDRLDTCPDTPAGAKVDAAGCPIDTDGDGVFDGLDQCPDTPKGWPVDEKGCPKDTDGDGVPDGKDACADTPKGATVDDKGCPADTDGDGVLDGIDKCADTPKGAKVNPQGCPLDADNDGVFDGLDQCPDTPKGVAVDEKGCPLPPKTEPLFPMEQKKLILEGVNFEVDKATLTPESLAVLDKVAASLIDWPEVRVEIGGHTDSSGSTAHNLDLSRRRAEAVRDYLVSKGVDTSRMVPKGYGEAQPIADNSTRDGKAKNRRVELTKLE